MLELSCCLPQHTPMLCTAHLNDFLLEHTQVHHATMASWLLEHQAAGGGVRRKDDAVDLLRYVSLVGAQGMAGMGGKWKRTWVGS